MLNHVSQKKKKKMLNTINFTTIYLQIDVARIDWCHLNNIINQCESNFFLIGDTSICKTYVIKILVSLALLE